MAFRRAAGTRRPAVLSFCGPVILLLYVLLWAVGLTLGAGLIIHPDLGTGVQAGNGPTPTDLLTALYAGGSSMAIVGASDFKPATDAYRVVYLVTSLIGMSVTSLVLTYVMQVYGALRQRNALGFSSTSSRRKPPTRGNCWPGSHPGGGSAAATVTSSRSVTRWPR